MNNIPIHHEIELIEDQAEAFYKAAFNAGLEAAAKVCEANAARQPTFKDFEDSYVNGWLDASNECGWAIRALEMK